MALMSSKRFKALAGGHWNLSLPGGTTRIYVDTGQLIKYG